MLATQFTTGGGDGGATNIAFVVIVVLLLAGFVLYRLIAPVIRFMLKALETVAELSLKAGLYLIYAGVAALLLAFGYVMFAS